MNPIALLVFTDLGRREGLSYDRAIKFGVAGALMGLQPLALIVVQMLMQREAAAARSTAVAVTPPGK